MSRQLLTIQATLTRHVLCTRLLMLVRYKTNRPMARFIQDLLIHFFWARMWDDYTIEIETGPARCGFCYAGRSLVRTGRRNSPSSTNLGQGTTQIPRAHQEHESLKAALNEARDGSSLTMVSGHGNNKNSRSHRTP